MVGKLLTSSIILLAMGWLRELAKISILGLMRSKSSCND